MSRSARICGFQLNSVSFLAVILYFIDRSLAALDGYEPGVDYPVYEQVPEGLSFTCNDKIPGYYADPETMCQVWHWCVPSIGGNIKYSFLCGPGTVFNQRTRVCDWFFKTDCPNAQAYYGINEDLYKDESGNYINGKKLYTHDDTHDQRRMAARLKRQEMMQKKQKHNKQEEIINVKQESNRRHLRRVLKKYQILDRSKLVIPLEKQEISSTTTENYEAGSRNSENSETGSKNSENSETGSRNFENSETGSRNSENSETGNRNSDRHNETTSTTEGSEIDFSFEILDEITL